MMRISGGIDRRTHANNSIEPRDHRSSRRRLLARRSSPDRRRHLDLRLRSDRERSRGHPGRPQRVAGPDRTGLREPPSDPGGQRRHIRRRREDPYVLHHARRTRREPRGASPVPARRAQTPADAVRDAEVVITVLTDPPALEDVLFGPHGAAPAIPHSCTLIDMSTVGPAEIASVAERLAPVNVLDAPVLGSVPSVEAGRLMILVGGDREAFERHGDLLAVLGTPMYVGPSGSGAWLKLINNAASIGTLVALGELLALTDRAGLEIDVVLDSLKLGP